MIFHFSSPLIAKAYDATLIKVRMFLLLILKIKGT